MEETLLERLTDFIDKNLTPEAALCPDGCATMFEAVDKMTRFGQPLKVPPIAMSSKEWGKRLHKASGLTVPVPPTNEQLWVLTNGGTDENTITQATTITLTFNTAPNIDGVWIVEIEADGTVSSGFVWTNEGFLSLPWRVKESELIYYYYENNIPFVS